MCGIMCVIHVWHHVRDTQGLDVQIGSKFERQESETLTLPNAVPQHVVLLLHTYVQDHTIFTMLSLLHASCAARTAPTAAGLHTCCCCCQFADWPLKELHLQVQGVLGATVPQPEGIACPHQAVTG